MRAAFGIVLPLPSELDLSPVWSHPRLLLFVQHRAFIPLSMFVLLLMSINIWIVGSAGGWAVFGLGAAAFCIWGVATLSQMDRRMISALLRTFEWWLLIANMLMYIICRGVELRWKLQRMLAWFIAFGCGVCIFSLDALLQLSRLVKGAVVAGGLIWGICNFVTEHLAFQLARSEDVLSIKPQRAPRSLPSCSSSANTSWLSSFDHSGFSSSAHPSYTS
jgi:hypothetical protein